MNPTINILKQVGLISLTITAMGTVGVVLNNFIPWVWLTNFFIIMRHLLPLIDFMFDTTTLLTLLGIMLTVQIALWAWKGSNLVIDWFKKY